VELYRKQEGCKWKHGISQMEGDDYIIPKEEHAFRHEARIRRHLILNDMIQ